MRRRRMRGLSRVASRRRRRATPAGIAGDLGHVVPGWPLAKATEAGGTPDAAAAALGLGIIVQNHAETVRRSLAAVIGRI
jgi:hypothetical protein